MRSDAVFNGENYRNYLMTLARIQLASAGPVKRKLYCADLVQDALLQAHLAADQLPETPRRSLPIG